ncbi:VanZ family protein [Lacticaseibacillus sp. GG6-2]
MLFLGPLYRIVAASRFAEVNHWPLLRLVFYSLDKTLLYLIIFLAVRWGSAVLFRRPLALRHELKVAVFAGYIILLLALTVFRDVYYPWQLQLHWHRSLSVINTTPLIETLKLRQGQSQFDFWYQSLGNVIWFLPFGWGVASLTHRFGFIRVALGGLALSLMIECLQFLLISGVADIDDVIFNVTGALCGYLAFRLCRPRR